MHTKSIRWDFDFSIGSHPGDRSVDYGWGMQTMAIFRKRAHRQTLGRDFLEAVYDDESPSHLIIHFANTSSVNLVFLSAAVERLVVACRGEANDEMNAFSKRNSGPQLSGYERFSLVDASRLPEARDHGVSTVSEQGDVEARRALLRWMRDTAWRLHPEGYVGSIQWLNHPGTYVPAVALCNFYAPFPNRDSAPLEKLVVRYQRALRTELERVSCGRASATQPTPWP